MIKSDVDRAVIEILQGYAGEVEETVVKEITAVTKETAKLLRSTAPKDTGEYRKAWTSRLDRKRMHTVGTVYNKKKPGLAHLLEYGHGPGKRGWRVPAYPHIRKAAAWAEEEIMRRLQRNL